MALDRGLLSAGALALGALLFACGGDNGGGPDGSLDGSPFGDGNVFPDGGGGDSGNGCSPYENVCNGVCTSTSDPKNCGGCGVTCPSTQVCSAGGCADNCLIGLSKCNGTCVDFAVDNNNCGSCGHACPPTQGCVEGTCQGGEVSFKPTSKCSGNPPNIVDDRDAGTCTGNLAKKTFGWTVCACNNVSGTSAVYADAWDSTKGTYKPKQIGGGIGADLAVTSDDVFTVYGKLHATATTGNSIDTQGTMSIYDEVGSQNNIGLGAFTAGADVYCGGDISGGTMSIAGTLYQPTGKQHGGVTYKALSNGPVNVAQPCNCTYKIPVAAIVDWGKTHNDNSLISLDPNLLATTTGTVHVDLPCGEYYLSGFNLQNAAAIVVHGNTAIFIDGDIQSSAFLEISLADQASELDIFVKGTINPTSSFTLGSPNWPALTHVYLGTTNAFTLSDTTIISGNVWVGNATVDWTSTTDMFGAVFSNQFNVSSALNIHYDSAVTHTGTDCNDAGPPGPPPPW